jgi:hypothetical protein
VLTRALQYPLASLQLPEIRRYPWDFESGQSYETRLKGHNVTLTVDRCSGGSRGARRRAGIGQRAGGPLVWPPWSRDPPPRPLTCPSRPQG